jgi:hypothetical protein
VPVPATSMLVPRDVPLSRKFTLPVGVPPEPLTTAVIVTGWPTTVEGSGEAESRMNVGAVVGLVMGLEPGFTTCDTTVDVLVPKLAVARYWAVMEWVAAVSDDVPNIARPLVSGTVPSELAPSKNVTLPVGVAPVELETNAENSTN